MKDDLKQLIASKAPAYVSEKHRVDVVRAVERAWYDNEMERGRHRHVAALLAVSAIFAWVASPTGQELIGELLRTGLGRVQLGSHEAALFSDGRIELYAFAKQWSQRRTFRSVDDFAEQTAVSPTQRNTITCFDRPAIEVAKLIADGTIVDRIAERLKTP
jgi:hypothetical protein